MMQRIGPNVPFTQQYINRFEVGNKQIVKIIDPLENKTHVRRGNDPSSFHGFHSFCKLLIDFNTLFFQVSLPVRFGNWEVANPISH